MRTSFLAQLCAALVLASLFLPWFSDPFLGQIVPYRLLAQIDPSQFGQRLADLPAEGIAFAASFALAALMLLLGTMGSTPRFLAVLTGGLPVALSAWTLIRNYLNAKSLEPDSAAPDLGRFLTDMTQALQPGAWLWLGAAGVLLLLGLFDRPSRPSRR